MPIVSFCDFARIMSYDVSRKSDPCIEVSFKVSDSLRYQDSWLGKMLDKETNQPVYWLGLVPDGSEAYDYDSFEMLSNAAVFNGKSLREIWGKLIIVSIDGGDVSDIIPYYLTTIVNDIE
ncbi:MAG: hypothetical protein FWE20_01715 [Defluviitaleaceae bacterium]|nr:hypothetical protein [Defluviitaleaceae bacterium]